MRRAHAVHAITALQTEYSLFARDAEVEILPACRELGIGFVAYSPLGRGMLTGAIPSLEHLAQDDFRRTRQPRFNEENFARNVKVVEQLRSIAREKGITPAQLALAWLLHQGKDIVPIPGTKRRSRLEENCAAVDIVLSGDDLDRIEAAAPRGAIAGERYSDMSSVNV